MTGREEHVASESWDGKFMLRFKNFLNVYLFILREREKVSMHMSGGGGKEKRRENPK